MKGSLDQARAPMRAAGFLLIAVGFAWLAAGCGGDDPVTVSPATGSVVFHFDQEVDGTPLVIQSSQTNFPDTNAAGNPYNVSFLQYFVSNLRLHNANGSTFGTNKVHFRDASDDAGTRSRTLSGVPSGTYNAVSFTFGLDAKTNVTDALLPLLALEWPSNWGGGYHYMEMNGQYFNGSTAVSYRTHTGRRFIEMSGDPSGQGPDSVAFHHFFEVYAPVPPFQVDGDTWELQAIMNVNGWYENPLFDLSTFFATGTEGIMVNLFAQDLLMENGLTNVYRVTDPVKRRQ
ncbi:MAG: MbnP family protein [Candidatus Krumholzibacteriia bacterium]